MATEARAAVPDQRDRVPLLGAAVDRVDMESALDAIERMIQARRFGQHMAVNAAKLVAMKDDPRLAEMVNRCELVTADGQALVWASKILRDPLPERVAGIDLMEELFTRAEQRGHRVYILGAKQEVLERAVARIRQRHPRLELAGYRDGYFTEAEDEQVAADIRSTKPDILFVAMSSPRKEYFLGTRGPETGAAFAMGVGGAIDVVAGEARRAPRLVQRVGLEWLFRLLQEPRRLLRRYALTNVRFLGLLLRAALGRSR